MTAFNIGEPLDDLPGAARGAVGQTIWDQIAEQVKAQPGQWFPIELPGRTTGAMKSLATRIRSHHISAPKAVREGFETAHRGGVLYLRYVGDES